MPADSSTQQLGDHLEVGRVMKAGSTEHFIAVSLGKSERCMKAFSGDEIMVIRIERDDIPWLIEALEKELELVKQEQ